MGRLFNLLAVGLVGLGVSKLIKNNVEAREEEQRRRNSPCHFNDGISENDFRDIAMKAKKKIRRIKEYSVDGPIVRGTVRSNSGISSWDFRIDFNDYGHITGKYWLTSENYDSGIPTAIADNICVGIREFLNSPNDGSCSNDKHGICCPYCGAKIWILEETSCPNCGKTL